MCLLWRHKSNQEVGPSHNLLVGGQGIWASHHPLPARSRPSMGASHHTSPRELVDLVEPLELSDLIGLTELNGITALIKLVVPSSGIGLLGLLSRTALVVMRALTAMTVLNDVAELIALLGRTALLELVCATCHQWGHCTNCIACAQRAHMP